MTTLQRIAAMCGNPDAAEGCRQILKVIKESTDYEERWNRMIKHFNFNDPHEQISGADLIEWICNEVD